MKVFIPPKQLYEYWIFTTMDCNLRCSYCFEESKIKGSKPSYKTEDLVNFIALHNPYRQFKCEHAKNGVVFSGGEPLMNQDFIKDFMEKTKKDLRLEYVLQTNGTLLDGIEPNVLENLDFIFVSLDGPKEIHDKNRGKGTFDKIIGNVRKIKSDYKGQIAARITTTVDKDFSIYDSVMALDKDFDNFHWQIETPVLHTTTEEGRKNFLEKYEDDLDKLADYWIKGLQKDKAKNIIPFQSVLNPSKKFELRCGSGTRMVVVDLDGQCYGCDTMVGDPIAKIGNIWEGAEPERLQRQLVMNCSGNPLTCEEENYKEKPGCMKMCLGCSETESREFYCSTVHVLADKIMERKSLLNSLLNDGKIKRENLLLPRIAEYTEKIP